MNVFTAPDKVTSTLEKIIFLAGSIEQDKAEKWQDNLIKKLALYNVTQ